MSVKYSPLTWCHYNRKDGSLKPCIFVVNKWDTMVGQMPTERWGEYLRDSLPFAEVPIRLLFRKRESADAKDEIEAKRKS
jgi:predicted GTPase